MGTIKFGGLATGLDTTSLISSLVSAERAPITALSSQRSLAVNKQSLYKDLTARATDLQAKADALKKATVARSATSSDSAKVRATASTGASAGAHTLSVTARASATTLASPGHTSATATGELGTGTLKVTVGTTTTDIAIGAGADSLEKVRDAINASGASVRASIVNDGSSTPNRLVLTGTGTGLANAVSLDASGLTGGAAPLTTTTLAAAQDAAFTLDGVAMTRGTNSVTDALDGVTIELLDKTTVGVPVTLEVATDGASSTRPLQDLVTSFNSIVGYIRDRSKVGTTSTNAGPLLGDASAMGATRSLAAALGNARGTGNVTNLAAIGITTAKDGTLTIDPAKVAAAWAKSPGDVQALVADVGAKLAPIADALDDTTVGAFGSKASSIDKRLRDIDKQIAKKEAALIRLETQLTARFTALETLSSKLQATGSLLTQLTNQGNNK